MSDRPRIVEAWLFDGTKESIEEVLRRYPRVKFGWRPDGDSLVTCGKYQVAAGTYVARLDSGALEPRSEKSVRKAGLLDDEDPDAEEEDFDGEPRHRAEPARGVEAWFFDGTRESVRDALAKHDDLYFFEENGETFVMWNEIREAKTRDKRQHREKLIKHFYAKGRCVVRLADGTFTRWQARRCRRQGLLPPVSRVGA